MLLSIFMTRHLPSLNALRAFEAAARLLSFTNAANELNVTQAAISHQVKALEDQMGIPLFIRRNRHLVLTDAGRALLPDISASLDRMSAAVARVRREDNAGLLTVATMDSLAATWLMPRLMRFRAENPEIEVRLAVSDAVRDYDEDGIDIGIRYGRGDWPGVVVTELMREEVFPVCAPSLLTENGGLETPQDLRKFTLIHDELTEDWKMWLHAAGVADIDYKRGPGYTHSNLVIQSAINGDGVALGRGLLVADALVSGLLVRPFPLALPGSFHYYIVTTDTNIERPKVRAFSNWLLREATLTAANLEPTYLPEPTT